MVLKMVAMNTAVYWDVTSCVKYIKRILLPPSSRHPEDGSSREC